ncbi:testis-expressed protein 19.2-like [Arvicola amphibius]|uniref:testis-expressed protein 19.2-like n=1 Tax=Arvicola amphibius TaxID=1047088 RepID=UPI0018E32BC7|nr:testis-expressed protein 19.2-like [Arvicola amphibius]
MCPPVNVHHGVKGMSCLYVEWLYHLVHGDQMKICFACFKAAFHANRILLQMVYGDEEPCQDKPQELSELGVKPEEESQPEVESQPKEESGPEELSGQICAEGQGELSDTISDHSSPGYLSPGSVGSDLEPEEAVPLDPGTEDNEWNQNLPWRLGSFYPCPHQNILPPLSLWDIFHVDPSPGHPVLLELSPLWPMSNIVGTWLENLDYNLVLCGCGNICYLLSMIPLWAVRTQVNRWQVLLDTKALFRAQMETRPQNLDCWRLSILKHSRMGIELERADCTLQKGGFKVHSYLPWHRDTPEEWSREPEERLFVDDIEMVTELRASSPEPSF